MKKTFAMTALAFCVMTAAALAEKRETYRDPALPADLPFSSAAIVGDTIYLAGEVGVGKDGMTLVEGGVGAETRQIFRNLEKTLGAVGSDLSDIVKCMVFLDDMSKFAEMNAAYAESLPDPKPARSTFGVEGLALGASLEIECLAVKGSGRKK